MLFREMIKKQKIREFTRIKVGDMIEEVFGGGDGGAKKEALALEASIKDFKLELDFMDM